MGTAHAPRRLRGRLCRVAATAGLLVTLGSACGDGEEDWIEVTVPAAGTLVTAPFEVNIDASVPLGPPVEGLHHAHLWFGDDQETYLVVESETVTINSAPVGEYDMHVTLHLADHTPVGAETSLPLVIGKPEPAGA